MMQTIINLVTFSVVVILFIVAIFVFSDNSDSFRNQAQPFYENKDIQAKIDKIVQLSNERLNAVIKVFDLSDLEISELKKFIVDNNIDIEHEQIETAILTIRVWKNKNETTHSDKCENLS